MTHHQFAKLRKKFTRQRADYYTTMNRANADEAENMRRIVADTIEIYFETYASKHTLQLMISLQDFLKKYGIEYVFIPYMELEKSPLQIETEVLDLNKFTTDPFVGHRNIFRFKGLACDEAGHPNELGNYFLLSKIL